MSWSSPASAWAAMVPPPHDWKRSGIGVRRGGRELGLERLVLEDRDVDLDVRVSRRRRRRRWPGSRPCRGRRWRCATSRSSRARPRPTTGRTAAALGAAALGAALAGALLAEPPLEQALIVSARTPSNPSVRFGFDMTCPPVISTLLLGWVRRMSVVGESPLAVARCRSVRSGRRWSESFGPVDDYFRTRTLGTRHGYRQEPFRQPVLQRIRCAVGRNFRYTAAMTSSVTGAKRRASGPTDDRSCRGRGRGLGADRLEGDQRPSRRVARDPAPRRGGHPGAGLSPLGPDPTDGTDPRAHLPRIGVGVGAGDRPGRRARRRPAPSGGRPVRAARPADPRPRLDRGRAGAPSDRRHRGLQRPQRIGADAAADPRHPVRRGRPDR